MKTMMRTGVTVLALCLLTAPMACGGPPGDEAAASSDEELRAADLSQNMPRARAVARRLGAYIDLLAHQSITLAGDPFTNPSAHAAFASTYGPRLGETPSASGYVLGGRFASSGDGDSRNLFTAGAGDAGQRTLFAYGMGDGSTLYFYQVAIVDPRTGELYQAVNAAGTNVYPLSRGARIDLYGPKLPPRDARLIGHFTDSEKSELSTIISRAAMGR